MKILYLNGPPGCGKDYFAEYLQTTKGIFFHRLNFKDPILDAIEPLLQGRDYEEMKRRNEPLVKGGPTVREFMIKYSEEFMKPLFGRNIFGRLMVQRIFDCVQDDELVVIPDSGFTEEVAECVTSLSAEHIILMLHRKGKSFEKDSRAYLGNKPGKYSEVEYQTYTVPEYKKITYSPNTTIGRIDVPEGLYYYDKLIEKVYAEYIQ